MKIPQPPTSRHFAGEYRPEHLAWEWLPGGAFLKAALLRPVFELQTGNPLEMPRVARNHDGIVLQRHCCDPKVELADIQFLPLEFFVATQSWLVIILDS
jgi:hypothetical protein